MCSVGGARLAAYVCVLRQSLAVRVLIVACLAVPLLAAGNAAAQSFFEKLFGLGDNRPQQSAAGVPSRAVPVRPAQPVTERDSGRDQRSSRAGDDEGRSGQTYQTMCVRTCDGYYWPVRYPAARGDFAQDANVCASTCGAQAKLYTRAGPGTEPEEMRDADGNSYGSTKTAFVYRKGLVNGCSCRGMPWSDAERARHEGYALAEAEKAIRLAQAEAEKVAVAAVEAERIATDKKHEQMMAAVAAAEAAKGAEARVAVMAEPVVGPAEAAAIARIAQVNDGGHAEADTAVVDEPVATNRRGVRGRDGVKARKSRPAQVAAGQRQRLPRGYGVSGPVRSAPRYAASVQKAPWWAQ